MNQSKTKSMVTLIALCTIVLVFVLLIASCIEIRQCYKLKQQIASQERQIEELENAKDYYESKLNQDQTYNDGDFIFEEE
ncbi:MAG: hypothetical protein IJ458_04835 [Clostridia bacterium]|nr:hypothetical protein [Clostridia bacterium]